MKHCIFSDRFQLDTKLKVYSNPKQSKKAKIHLIYSTILNLERILLYVSAGMHAYIYRYSFCCFTIYNSSCSSQGISLHLSLGINYMQQIHTVVLDSFIILNHTFFAKITKQEMQNIKRNCELNNSYWLCTKVYTLTSSTWRAILEWEISSRYINENFTIVINLYKFV